MLAVFRLIFFCVAVLRLGAPRWVSHCFFADLSCLQWPVANVTSAGAEDEADDNAAGSSRVTNVVTMVEKCKDFLIETAWKLLIYAMIHDEISNGYLPRFHEIINERLQSLQALLYN